MVKLADLKADMSRVTSVLGVIEDQAAELWRECSWEQRIRQISSLQATIAVLVPFAKKLDSELELFPDQIEVTDGGHS